MRLDAFELFLICSAILVVIRVTVDEETAQAVLHNLVNVVIGVFYV